MVEIALLVVVVLVPVVFLMSKMEPEKRIGCGCGCSTCGNRETCHRGRTRRTAKQPERAESAPEQK